MSISCRCSAEIYPPRFALFSLAGYKEQDANVRVRLSLAFPSRENPQVQETGSVAGSLSPQFSSGNILLVGRAMCRDGVDSAGLSHGKAAAPTLASS